MEVVMTRIVAILILTLVIVGCESTPPASETPQGTGGIEMGQKAVLLEQIDKQYENPEAHYQLGKLYEDGRGVPQKRERLRFQSTRFSSQFPKRPIPVDSGFQLMVWFN